MRGVVGSVNKVHDGDGDMRKEEEEEEKTRRVAAGRSG